MICSRNLHCTSLAILLLLIIAFLNHNLVTVKNNHCTLLMPLGRWRAKTILPFTRPPDYFAEMVKSDAHMERIRQRFLDEKDKIKRSEQKRKEREGKKFGKQVQMEKLKEREQTLPLKEKVAFHGL